MRPLGWLAILRLGLVQAALGAIVVMSTTVLNRVMAVELALPAVIPGALIALHHGAEMLRPRWGYGSDGAGRRTPWILGGMACLALGGLGAALATALIGVSLPAGLVLAGLSYVMIGLGAGATGTSLLTLAATRVAPERRPAAASLIWIMMILGFAVTAGIAGVLLDPFSPARLVRVAAGVSGLAFVVSALAVAGVEGSQAVAAPPRARPPFGEALRTVWAEPAARRFTLFIFVAMLAYGAQDLVVDPFAGRILGLTPGGSTSLTGLQHGSAVLGMVTVAVLGSLARGRGPGLLRLCAVGGCTLSAVALGGLALAGPIGPAFPLRAAVALLGFGNGAFAVAAIGAMMELAGSGAGSSCAGLRMGLWGAAQALAFALGSLAGPALVQLVSALANSPTAPYAATFAADAALFLAAARLVAAATTPAVSTEPDSTILLAARA